MTLDSRMFVADGLRPDQAFTVSLRAILAAEGNGRLPGSVRSSGHSAGTARVLETEPGQGLPACLRVYYRPGDAYRAEPESDSSGGDPYPVCHLEISFETSDGWFGPSGETPHTLHVQLITVVGQFLDEWKIRWSWLNQTTGRVHTNYRHLDQLGVPAPATTGEA